MRSFGPVEVAFTPVSVVVDVKTSGVDEAVLAAESEFVVLLAVKSSDAIAAGGAGTNGFTRPISPTLTESADKG